MIGGYIGLGIGVPLAVAEGNIAVVSTDDIQLPVNVVLHGHQREVMGRFRTFEGGPRRVLREGTGSRSRAGRLKGQKPSFRTRTDSKGFD